MPSQPAPIPPDDPTRGLTVARPDEDQSLPHIGLVGDTYTILVTGHDTAGRYTLIDMHVPPGGGPPPHRHDFEEMFTVLDGEVQVTFRGETIVARAGQTINVPANAPHAFTNAGQAPVRLLCLCAPAGQEEFFTLVGQPVATRTEPPPPLDAEAQAAFIAKSMRLAPQYETELLPPPGRGQPIVRRTGSTSSSTSTALSVMARRPTPARRSAIARLTPRAGPMLVDGAPCLLESPSTPLC